jgi:phosphatidate phosphatase APP1
VNQIGGRLLSAARFVERQVDGAKFEIKRRFGLLDPLEVVPYRGHGTAEVVFLKGRVLEASGVTRSREDDPAWRNAYDTARRFMSDEVPGARVRAGLRGAVVETVADDEGFFDVRFDLAEGARVPDQETAWHPVEVELLGPFARGQEGARGEGIALVPGAGAEFGVISDLDDTVIYSRAAYPLRMAWLLLSQNVHKRLPFPGVADFYHALQRGIAGEELRNPIFYVSSSPWNIYDLIEDFLDVHGVPAGPIFLKDWSPTNLGRHTEHKMGLIRTLFSTYPELPFILIGDSGQKDPEIYAQAVREHPGRVRAVYIRDVTDRERDHAVRAIAGELRSEGVEMVLTHDTSAAAEHAVSAGFMTTGSAREVQDTARQERSG